MSILLITGDHPRHHFFAQSLVSTGLVSAWIRERRGIFNPQPPAALSSHLKYLYHHHFNERERIENQFFNTAQKVSIPQLNVSKQELNATATLHFIQQYQPQLVISYGCHKLSTALIEASNAVFWNTHGGLSPEYRGVITHFWPSYFLEPQMTGMTLHETTAHIDGGAILLQTAVSLIAGDTLHMVAARAVITFTETLTRKITQLDLKNLPQGIHKKAVVAFSQTKIGAQNIYR